MDEVEVQRVRPRASRGVTLLMLVILILAACALSYSNWADRLTGGYASYVALLAIPAALGGLFTSVVDSDGEYPLMGCFV